LYRSSFHGDVYIENKTVQTQCTRRILIIVGYENAFAFEIVKSASQRSSHGGETWGVGADVIPLKLSGELLHSTVNTELPVNSKGSLKTTRPLILPQSRGTEPLGYSSHRQSIAANVTNLSLFTMPSALILIADGSEEIEFVTPYDGPPIPTRASSKATG